MPSPRIPHYTRKHVQCPICGAFMRTIQGLNGHIRFRHVGQAVEQSMLWKMHRDGFLPVIDYPGLTPDDLNPALITCCYRGYEYRLKSGYFTPLAPWIPTSQVARIKAKRHVSTIIDFGMILAKVKMLRLRDENAR